jgi:hypothetical protein
MSFKLKQINDEVVKPIKVKKINPKYVLGYDLFPEIYANIFICAKKKSGKTCVINKIIQTCADKNTKVIIFSSTANKDAGMMKIIEGLQKKKRHVEVYTEIGQNLEIIIKDIELNIPELESKIDENTEEIERYELIHFNEDKKHIQVRIKKKKPKKPEKIAPEYIFIFDDISSELKRNPEVAKLVKQNRHYLCKVILSSQYPFDLEPESRKQVDNWLLFGGQPDKKLEKIYMDSDASIDFGLFTQLYHDATTEKYNFLYIDTNADNFRKNFSLLYQV